MNWGWSRGVVWRNFLKKKEKVFKEEEEEKRKKERKMEDFLSGYLAQMPTTIAGLLCEGSHSSVRFQLIASLCSLQTYCFLFSFPSFFFSLFLFFVPFSFFFVSFQICSFVARWDSCIFRSQTETKGLSFSGLSISTTNPFLFLIDLSFS